MNRPFLLAWLVVAVASLHCAAPCQDSTPRTPSIGDGFRERIRILPVRPQEDRIRPTPEAVALSKGNALADDALRIFRTGDEGKWKTFEDEIVGFEIPDDPLLKVDAITPEMKEPIGIVGTPVGSADRGFERAYRITIDRKLPYLDIFVREADWFDDGLCFCGAVVFTKWIATGGNLLAFDLLGSGEIKRGQALGAKHLALILEWTHSVITQDAYARIACSLRLKAKSNATTKEWQARTKSHLDGKKPFGWLEKGDSANRVRELLGAPASVEGGTWVYIEDRRGPNGSFRSTHRLPMKEGVFRGINDDWSAFTSIDSSR